MHLDQIPPHDAESEAAVLGSMLVSPVAAEVAVELLTENDFYNSRNRLAFRAFSSAVFETGEVDPLEVTPRLQGLGLVNGQGAGRLLGEYLEGRFHPGNVERYARLVKEAGRKRIAHELAIRILGKLNQEAPTDTELSALIGEAYDQLGGAHDHGEPRDLHELAEGIAHDALEGQPLETLGLRTGIGEKAFDELTHGLRPNRYIVLAARTGVGKSTLVEALCTGCRANNPDAGVPLLISTEMHPDETALGALASAAGVHRMGLLKRNLTELQRESVRKTVGNKKLAGVQTAFMCGATLAQVRAVALRHKRRYGLPLLVIDVVSKLKANGETIRERCCELSAGIEKLKVELNTCIIACVQINRAAVTDSAGHRPMPHHIKESGNWEEDADQIIMLHRPAYFGDSDDPRTEIIQWKDRLTSSVGSTWIEWKPATGRYEDANTGVPDFK